MTVPLYISKLIANIMIQLDDNGLCTGQFRIPSSMPVRCYPGSSTCEAASEDTKRSDMIDGSVTYLNHCCFDEGDGSVIQVTNPGIIYFSLNGGELVSRSQTAFSVYIWVGEKPVFPTQM